MNPPQSATTYEDVSFERINFNGSRIESSTFLDCQFAGCSLVEAELRSCRFQRCSFTDCDLSLLQLPSSEFSSTTFKGTKLVGVDWTMARQNQPALGNPLSFKASILNHCTFIGLAMPSLELIDCVAHEVDFRQTDLQSADFSGTDLLGSLFMETDLSGADLRTARNYTIDPTKNLLSGARLSMPEAISLLHALDIVLDESDNHP